METLRVEKQGLEEKGAVLRQALEVAEQELHEAGKTAHMHIGRQRKMSIRDREGVATAREGMARAKAEVAERGQEVVRLREQGCNGRWRWRHCA